MSVPRTLILILAVLCLPATARAVTVRDIIELSKAGLGDEVLVAVIEADRTIFTLDKQQILDLKRAGVSQAVILKMLRSRDEFEQPVEQPQVEPIFTQPELLPPPPAPPAPEPQNAAQQLYYYVPYPLWGVANPRHPRVPAQPFMIQPNGGFGRFINDGWVDRRVKR
jgi:hypothetical protein